MTNIHFIRANRPGKPTSLRKLPWKSIDFNKYKILGNSGFYPNIAFDNNPSGRWIIKGDITFGNKGINSKGTINTVKYLPYLGLTDEYISFSFLDPHTSNMTLKKFKKLIKGSSKKIEKRLLKSSDYTLNTYNANIKGSKKSEFITGKPYEEQNLYGETNEWGGRKSDYYKYNSRYSIDGGKGDDIIAFRTGNVEVYGGKGDDIFNVDFGFLVNSSTRPATSFIMDAKKGDKIYVNGPGIYSSYGGPGKTTKTEVVKTAAGYDLIYQDGPPADGGALPAPETFLSIKGHDLEYQGINELTAAEIPHKSFDEYHYSPYMIFA